MKPEMIVYAIGYLIIALVLVLIRIMFLSVAIKKGDKARYYFSKDSAGSMKIYDECAGTFFFILGAAIILPYKLIEHLMGKFIDGLMIGDKEKVKDPIDDILDS